MLYRSTPEAKRKWWILGAMTTSISMVFIDVTVLPVALPTISRELNFSQLGLQWILNAYTLALTVLVLAGGRIAQMFGLKSVFSFGICLFALSSAMCGFGNTESWLVFSRAVQGAGGALMLPATQAIISESFPIKERGKAIGIFISIGSVFLALGPLIGGYLTEFATWRYVFWINLPIAAIGLVLTQLTVPSFPKNKSSFDFLGFFTSLFGISSIVVAIMQAQQWGWLSPRILFLLGLGAILIVLLFHIERSQKMPLIDIDLLKTSSILTSLSIVSLTQFLVMTTVFWAIFFQTISGYLPSEAGNITFIAYAPLLIAAPLAGICIDKFGPRLPITIGFSLLIISLVWFVLIAKDFSIHELLPSLLCFGAGVPFVMTSSSTFLLSAAPKEKRGIASGLLILSRQFSATLGLAIFGTINTQWTNWRFEQIVTEQSTHENLDPRSFEGLLSHNPTAIEALKEVPPDVAQIIQNSLRDASISGFNLINMTAALLAFLGLLISLRWMKKKKEEAQ
ncbi:MAG: MFS transporter [Verrucomicrobia bacterium]|nr:MFS transporter [Verrucomicrobiota bacterium]